MKAAIIASVFTLSSLVNGHGYLIKPSSRTRLGAEVETIPHILNHADDPRQILIPAQNVPFSNQSPLGQISQLRKLEGVGLVDTTLVSLLITTSHPTTGAHQSRHTLPAKPSTFNGVSTTTAITAECSPTESVRTKHSSTNS